MKRIDISGQVFGRLRVIRYYGTNKNGKALWECLCDCGKTTICIGENLKNGVTRSCGCLRKEIETTVNVTHGMSRIRPYKIWVDMKKRCNNPKNKEYPNYGGRGIKVCVEWENDFPTFYKWAISNGYDDSLTIDRKDVNGNYCPENCRWSTLIEQGRNKRLSPKNTTGVSGVTYKKQDKAYVARITVDGKRVYLGEYKTLDEAIKARKEAESKFWGGDANARNQTV